MKSEKTKNAYPEFSVDGFQIPEGVKPGEDFEIVATLRASESGTLMLIAVEGMPVTQEEPDSEKEKALESRDPKSEMFEKMRGFYEKTKGQMPEEEEEKE